MSRGSRVGGGWGIGVVVAAMAAIAFLSPVLAGEGAPPLVGLLLIGAGMLEAWQGFRRATLPDQRAAWIGGAITIAMGVLVSNAAVLVATSIAVLLAGWFALDGIRYVRRGLRGDYARATDWLLPALGNLGVAFLLIALRHYALGWTLALAGGLRIGGTAWSILSSPVFTATDAGGTVLAALDLPDDPALTELADRVASEERGREALDNGWILAFIATLFAIHLGRMGFDRSRLGISSPLVAVVGDLFLALVIAFAIVIPLRLLIRRLTRGLERQGWRWCLAGQRKEHWSRRPVRVVLTHRLRFSVRMRSARYSARTALSRGLQIGLPWAAILAASVPVFGMSWFFDTENWAAGMWNSLAEARTDTWRKAMVMATFEAESAKSPADWYSVSPPGATAGADFSFLVIGDPGEGDASQHVLRDQVLTAAARNEVKFIREQYAVPTGFQRAPFFDVQTDEFALIAVDTGVARTVDPLQWRWLEAALDEARGKLVMVVLGHPFYAGGHYLAADNEPFARLHGLLKRHGVTIVMAGDTHDLEYYVEEHAGDGGPQRVQHFVNGGGGAYLSFGTALTWPASPATSRWGFYPTAAQVRSKIAANMTLQKLPLWWWADKLDAWPFAVEWVSSAFDFKVAPFYQSFVEVRVEPSARRVRIIPYGIAGRLRWRDFQGSPEFIPAVATDGDFAEWTVEMPSPHR